MIRALCALFPSPTPFAAMVRSYPLCALCRAKLARTRLLLWRHLTRTTTTVVVVLRLENCLDVLPFIVSYRIFMYSLQSVLASGLALWFVNFSRGSWKKTPCFRCRLSGWVGGALQILHSVAIIYVERCYRVIYSMYLCTGRKGGAPGGVFVDVICVEVRKKKARGRDV